MGWQARAKRTIVSEWIELESVEGLRIKTRKFSVEERNRIDQLQHKMTESNKEFFRSLTERYYDDVTDAYGEFDFNRILAYLQENGRRAEAVELTIELQSMQDDGAVDLVRRQLEAGLEEVEDQDTDGGDWKPVDKKAFCTDVLQYEALTAECIRHIQERNRPLAKTTSEKSEQSVSSSTEDTSTSDLETPIPTEPSPTS